MRTQAARVLRTSKSMPSRKQTFLRSLRIEFLECRCLLAADLNYLEEFDSTQVLVELADSANGGESLPEGSQQIGTSSWWTVPADGDVHSTVAVLQQLPGVISAMPGSLFLPGRA